MTFKLPVATASLRSLARAARRASRRRMCWYDCSRATTLTWIARRTSCSAICWYSSGHWSRNARWTISATSAAVRPSTSGCSSIKRARQRMSSAPPVEAGHGELAVALGTRGAEAVLLGPYPQPRPVVVADEVVAIDEDRERHVDVVVDLQVNKGGAVARVDEVLMDIVGLSAAMVDAVLVNLDVFGPPAAGPLGARAPATLWPADVGVLFQHRLGVTALAVEALVVTLEPVELGAGGHFLGSLGGHDAPLDHRLRHQPVDLVFGGGSEVHADPALDDTRVRRGTSRDGEHVEADVVLDVDLAEVVAVDRLHWSVSSLRTGRCRWCCRPRSPGPPRPGSWPVR